MAAQSLPHVELIFAGDSIPDSRLQWSQAGSLGKHRTDTRDAPHRYRDNRTNSGVPKLAQKTASPSPVEQLGMLKGARSNDVKLRPPISCASAWSFGCSFIQSTDTILPKDSQIRRVVVVQMRQESVSNVIHPVPASTRARTVP